MKIKCDYCGNTYEEFQEKCPNCGAPNPSHHDGDNQPRTIEELKKWYEDRHLPPPETTRFFIGVNYTKPRAFGIYRDDNGEFIVYKNKADGSRAIRYKGRDEAYAVDELYQKLKDEIIHQKTLSRSRSASSNGTGSRKSRGFNKVGLTIMLVWFGIAIASSLTTIHNNRHNGYYTYHSTVYYNDSDTWYYYDNDYDDWYLSTPPAEYSPENTDPYYMGRTYQDISWQNIDPDLAMTGGNVQNFTDVKNSASYQENHVTSSSDSDYDWDSDNDSWDSDSTDWDSDW